MHDALKILDQRFGDIPGHREAVAAEYCALAPPNFVQFQTHYDGVLPAKDSVSGLSFRYITRVGAHLCADCANKNEASADKSDPVVDYDIITDPQGDTCLDCYTDIPSPA